MMELDESDCGWRAFQVSVHRPPKDLSECAVVKAGDPKNCGGHASDSGYLPKVRWTYYPITIAKIKGQ